jgi:acyl transferase domain-containing protein/NAD(P)-dependent dehydrogenase (short-subunit alcohol dehydrogenase family)
VLAGEHDPAAGLVQPPGSLVPPGSPARPGSPAQPAERPSLAFLFPGQGSQRTGALAELFVAFPELRQYLRIGERWADKLFPPAPFDPERERQQADLVRDTAAAQPTLGMCGLAVSHLLGRLGISPDMSGGHSYGELVALSVAGAFSPQTLLDLSDARATAILSVVGEDPGTMAAVRAASGQVAAVLDGRGLADQVVLANLNAPGQVVISGPTPAIDNALQALKEASLTTRRLPVACAFHSPVVAAASGRFAQALAARQVSPPRLPVWSNRTARPYPDDPGLIREELAAQISAPVRFSDQVEAMYAAGARIFIEAGPGQVLTGLVRAVLGDRPHLAVACDGPPGQGLRKFLTALAELACAGVPLNLGWLFQGRNTADPAAKTADERPRWTANGQLIRDANGDCPPGGLTPARLIKEFSMSSNGMSSNGMSANGASADPGSMLAEYLRVSREMVAAQRDVMLAALGGQPGGRLVWQQEGAALTMAAPATPATHDGTAHDGTARDAAAAVMPLSGPELRDTLVTLISERTGYPTELIEPDLDLEADLSIDSIKRAEIAAELAARLGMSPDTELPESAETAFEELVRARTLRAIIDRFTQLAATETTAEATAEAAADGESPGGIPLRLVPRLVSLDGPPEAAAARSVAGARIVITGQTPVAGQLAARLRELGAQPQVTACAEISTGDVQDADGLVLLDGLAEAPGPLPPALFPLIKTALTSAAADTRRVLLAAGDRGRAEAAGLAGMFRSVAAEYPDHLARYVELDQAAHDQEAPAEDIARLLLAELLAGAPEPAVTYRGDVRHRVELAAAELDLSARGGVTQAATGPAEARVLGLDRDSVVLLIGGARGITAWFGRELAAASGCRIELVGRTQLPGDPLPSDIEAAPDAAAVRAALARQGMRVPAEIERATRDILARREASATVAELRELGAQVRYHCADARDAEAISQVIKLVHAEHGRIDGLVYAAGIVEDKLIADKDPESFARVFRTKVSGASVTLATLREQQCEPLFVVLYGSIAAAVGNRGQADYAAANDALEALGAAWAADTGRRCLTVHWGPWTPAGAHPGMVTPELGREYARRGVATIDPRQGAASLLRELAWGDPGLTSVIYAASVPHVG